MIIGRQSGLGRGLGALIPPKPSAPVYPTNPLTHAIPGTELPPPTQGIQQIPVEQIERNPHQPRTHFDHAQLEDLISSIKEHGVIQPLVVSPLPDGRYQLIAGERRLRASTIAGLTTVPALVRTVTEQEKLELAVIENVQRQDLNPIEEAKAYQRLMDEFSLTQDVVSKKMSKSRPQVANTVRLLQLAPPIQDTLIQGRTSAFNARRLLSLSNHEERFKLFEAMLAGNFTVRQTEARVAKPRQPKKTDANVMAAEESLRQALHCRVQIKRDHRGEGEIRLKFFSDEELQALMKKLGNKE